MSKTIEPTECYLRGAVPIAEVHKGGAEIIDRLAAEWRELCEEGPIDCPFYRPEWVRAYVRAFAPRGRVIVIAARVGGKLAAVLPLVEEMGLCCGLPVRKLRGAANWHSCRFDLVRTAGPEGDAAVSSVWESLRELPGWHMLELADVPEAGALEPFVRTARADGYQVGRWASIRSPYIPIPEWHNGDWWPPHVSGNFRRNLGRVGRNLNSCGEVRITRVDQADSDVLQRFYGLESSGWKGRDGTAIACTASTRQFYDEIARDAERFGYLSLYFLESNGRTIAGHFGFTYRRRYFMPKVAYDETYEQYAPGHLLVRGILRDLLARGIREYDFVGPDQEWKMKWTATVRPHACFYIFRKGLYPHALWAARFRAIPAIRKMLSGWASRGPEQHAPEIPAVQP